MDNPDNNRSNKSQVGNYHIIGKLGDGGFGDVYLGRHIFLKRIAAIKILRTSPGASQKEKEDLLQEGERLAKLNHPCILPIFDAGIEGDVVYIAMEYAEQGSLRRHLQERLPRLLPLQESLKILTEVGDALQFVHQHNLVHSDVKPENILFNQYKQATLADFGNAILLDPQKMYQGPIRGTPFYMAPEQSRGIVCAASDQYSLGCIAYELFTGQQPFTAAGRDQLIQKHLYETPIPLREVNASLPAHIDTATIRALEKEVSARHSSVSEFILSLQRGSDKNVIPSTASNFVSQKQPISMVAHEQAPQINIGSRPNIVAIFQNASSEARIQVPVSNEILQTSNEDPTQTLLDLRLPPFIKEVLATLLARFNLTLDNDQALDKVTYLCRDYTKIVEAPKQHPALLYIPGRILNNAIPKNIAALANVAAAFDKGSTLVVFSDTSESRAKAIENIMDKSWKEDRDIKTIFVPEKHLNELKDMHEAFLKIWLTEDLELGQIIEGARK